MQAEQDRAALQHMTRVSLLGQLSASIAHQLNQPLASILGNAEAAQKMLEREPVDLPELREICNDIVAEDHRAAAGDSPARRAVQARRTDVRAARCQRAGPRHARIDAQHADSRQVTRGRSLAPDLPRIAGDRVQLQQIAAEPDRQRRRRDGRLPEPERRADDQHRSCTATPSELCVADRGPGIPARGDGQAVRAVLDHQGRWHGHGPGDLPLHRAWPTAAAWPLTNAPEGGAVFCARAAGAGDAMTANAARPTVFIVDDDRHGAEGAGAAAARARLSDRHVRIGRSFPGAA